MAKIPLNFLLQCEKVVVNFLYSSIKEIGIQLYLRNRSDISSFIFTYECVKILSHGNEKRCLIK